MKKETRQCIAILLTGIPLSVIAATIGGAVAVLVVGCVEEVAKGRALHSNIKMLLEFCSSVLLVGPFVIWPPAAPSILVMIFLHAYWRTGLQMHVLMTMALSFALGVVSIVTLWMMKPDEYSNMLIEGLVRGAACFAVVIIAELLMRKKLSGKRCQEA
jgi:hypothetical protein